MPVDPDPTYVQARLDASPAWFRDPVGSAVSVGFGREEDAQALLNQQAVQARYPLLAPMDTDANGVVIPGVSTALSLIGNDRQLLPPFVDDPQTLNGYRAWLMSGMTTAAAAGYTLPWFPQTTYEAGTTIGNSGTGTTATGSIVGGLVWTCVTAGVSGSAPPFPLNARVGQVVTESVDPSLVAAQWAWQGSLIAQGVPWQPGLFFLQGSTVYGGGLLWINTSFNGGTSGPTFPFPEHPSPNQFVQDQTCRWQLLSVPVDPAAPGYYSSGTIDGLTAAFVNSGLFDVDSSGTVVPPRWYTNNDWHNTASTPGMGNAGNGTVAITGYAGALVDLDVLVNDDGTAGVVDSGSISFAPASVAVWASGITVAVGEFIQSAHGDVFYCSTSGITGSSTDFPLGDPSAPNPFPSSTPSPATWPPSYGQGFTDGITVQWTFATYSPIPTVVPIGSYGVTFMGDFVAADTYEVSYTPAPPDGKNGAWARLWAVVPVGNFSAAAKLWGDGTGGSNRPQQFAGLWGRSPNNLTPGNHTPPVPWGLTGSTNPNYVYGLIQSILARWTSGMVRFIGCWVVLGADTAIDTIPATSPWREWNGITINGVNPPFFRYNNDT